MKYRLALLATIALVVSLFVPGPVAGQEAPLRVAPPEVGAKSLAAEAPPLRLAEGYGVAPLASLGSATTGAGDALAAVTAWNLAGNRPVRNGIVRPLASRVPVRFDASFLVEPAGLAAGGVFTRSRADRTLWGGEVRVEGAHRLRLHLSDVRLPEGTRLWIYGDDTVHGPFGGERIAGDGTLWTPSVPGPAARLEVELPDHALGSRARWGFMVDRVAQLFPLDGQGRPLIETIYAPVDDSCLELAACVEDSTFPVVDLAQRAIAQVEFISADGFPSTCTGGLLNDVEQTNTPFLLTANHCLSTQPEASTVEAFWDFTPATCDGPFPDSLPTSSGATLLASRVRSDFTLLELDSLPPGRVFLGWTADPDRVTVDESLHRISHPVTNGILRAQRYSQFRLEPDYNLCGPDPDGRQWDSPVDFIHSTALIGGDFGGSSGGPLILDTGQVVGQLLGSCGPDPAEGCDRRNDYVDGAFAVTFETIEGFLFGLETPTPPPGPWLQTAQIPGFRFKVRITAPGGGEVIGNNVPACIDETLCVSGAVAGRAEVFVRVIGPRPNGLLWPLTVKFTPSQVEVWIEQLSSGDTKYYFLEGASPGVDELPGLFDRNGFTP